MIILAVSLQAQANKETKLTMKKMITFISHPLVLIAAAVLVVGIFSYFGSAANPAPKGAAGIVALQLAFTPEKFLLVLDAWGEQGVGVFTNTMWLDFIFPLAYAFLFSGLLARLLGEKAAGKTPVFVFLPFAAAFFDYLENILHLVIVGSQPYRLGLVLPASLAALIKWVLLLLVVLLWVGLLLKKLLTKSGK